MVHKNSVLPITDIELQQDTKQKSFASNFSKGIINFTKETFHKLKIKDKQPGK